MWIKYLGRDCFLGVRIEGAPLALSQGSCRTNCSAQGRNGAGKGQGWGKGVKPRVGGCQRYSGFLHLAGESQALGPTWCFPFPTLSQEAFLWENSSLPELGQNKEARGHPGQPGGWGVGGSRSVADSSSSQKLRSDDSILISETIHDAF